MTIREQLPYFGMPIQFKPYLNDKCYKYVIHHNPILASRQSQSLLDVVKEEWDNKHNFIFQTLKYGAAGALVGIVFGKFSKVFYRAGDPIHVYVRMKLERHLIRPSAPGFVLYFAAVGIMKYWMFYHIYPSLAHTHPEHYNSFQIGHIYSLLGGLFFAYSYSPLAFIGGYFATFMLYFFSQGLFEPSFPPGVAFRIPNTNYEKRYKFLRDDAERSLGERFRLHTSKGMYPLFH